MCTLLDTLKSQYIRNIGIVSLFCPVCVCRVHCLCEHGKQYRDSITAVSPVIIKLLA